MLPKLALVLGGGGSRGIAHVGVLDVLTRENIPIDFIVGTSMGAIVGAYFAAGFDPQQIGERIAELQGVGNFGMHVFSAKGRQQKMATVLAKDFDEYTFADLQIPLVVTAVDMLSGKEIVLENGPLIPALLASSAVPAVFPPVEIDGMQLADGGVIDSVATCVAYERGYNGPDSMIVAVDVYPSLEDEDPWADPIAEFVGFGWPFSGSETSSPGPISALWRSFRVLAWHTHQERLKQHPPTVLLRPPLGTASSIDFTDVQGHFYAGLQEAQKHIKEIRGLFGDALPESKQEARAS